MRKLASFELRYAGPDAEDQSSKVLGALDSWLSSKGRLSNGTCTLQSGAVATVEDSSAESQKGKLRELVFTEPVTDGRFRTKVVVGHDGGQIVVGVTLNAVANRMGPTFVDVRVPKLVRDLIDIGITWRFGSNELRKSKLHLRGEAGGKAFEQLVFASDRSLPIVAVSEEFHGALLHPDLCDRMSGDLAGIATVLHLSEEASWYMTKRRGKEWSCYGGAVRLYWPGTVLGSDAYKHPLWSPWKLMQDVNHTEEASRRLRAQLRRMIFSQAVFFITEPELFGDIRLAARQEERSKLLKEASGVDEYRELLEEADRQLGIVETERDGLRKQVEDLESQLEQFKVVAEYRATQEDELAPNIEQIPSTPEDALLIAAEKFKNELLFGSDAYDEVSRLAPNAGPPEKILKHLEALAGLTMALREGGSLGGTRMKWLQSKGVEASIESDTIESSKKEQQARTWDDTMGGTRYFNEHTKPSNQTSPDRCVRIYYKYDDDSQKTIIGYIGGKFGL